MKYYIPECGGDAAKSILKFLTKLGYDRDLIFIDSDPKVVECYIKFGFSSILESDLNTNVTYDIYPCDEYFRFKFSANVYGGNGNCKYNDKLLSLINLTSTKSFIVPEIYNDIVIRNKISSGSKSLVSTNSTQVVTKFYRFDHEYVIDYCISDQGLTIWPRITYLLKNGRDTFVTLLGHKNREFKLLYRVVYEILDQLDIRLGYGNIQLGMHNNNYIFIEISSRVSGSSNVWLNSGVNMLDTSTYNKCHDLDAVNYIL